MLLKTNSYQMLMLYSYPHERAQSSDFAGLLFRLQQPVATWRSYLPTGSSTCPDHGGLLIQLLLHLWIHRPPQCCADQGLYTNLLTEDEDFPKLTFLREMS